MNERTFGAEAAEESLTPAWLTRLWRWLVVGGRPYLGWIVLILCMALSVLPALLLWENRWLMGESLQFELTTVGPLAVGVTWTVLGWRRPFTFSPRWLRIGIHCLLLLLIGLFVISQLLGHWLPSFGEWWRALTTRDWAPLTAGVVDDWQHLGTRYALWWQGVQQNNAVKDDLILAGIAACVIWLSAVSMSWLVRRFRRGFLAALPVLWPVGFIMLYSPAGRWLMVTGVGLALLLHLALDHRNLIERWERAGLDYNPTLVVDRSLTALSAFALVLIVALVMPNLYLYEVTARYYAWLKPVNQRMEAVSKRLFPGLTGVMPWGERGVQAGGLPNEFLLGAGPEIGRREVMRVRTDEPVLGYDIAPPGHTLRGATFSDYDGHGWHNPARSEQTNHAADQPWTTLDEAYRRPLLQSVNLRVDSSILFGAGEPLAPAVDYAAEQRFPGDLVALRAGVRSYTILSQLPALSEAELNALPTWGPNLPLPSPYALYLALPDSVTERTRQLAVQLTDNQATSYAKAAAIEVYLRQYPYDLTVDAPPEDVVDVADYFLFDLKRGYCDYYATAFVVLARLAGLPARFVTGFAPGSWSDRDRQWVITEAEAHSWPEVYFPEVGWVPFEPTAGRPSLPRVSRPSAGALSTSPAFEPLPPPASDEDFRPLLWFLLALLPVGAVALVVARWRASREDPWVALLRWGQRAGRPLQEGQTPLEYGRSLADYVRAERAKEPELGRTVSREVQALSRDVSSLHYAPETRRQALREQIIGRWKRLRMYLNKL